MPLPVVIPYALLVDWLTRNADPIGPGAASLRRVASRFSKPQWHIMGASALSSDPNSRFCTVIQTWRQLTHEGATFVMHSYAFDLIDLDYIASETQCSVFVERQAECALIGGTPGILLRVEPSQTSPTRELPKQFESVDIPSAQPAPLLRRTVDTRDMPAPPQTISMSEAVHTDEWTGVEAEDRQNAPDERLRRALDLASLDYIVTSSGNFRITLNRNPSVHVFVASSAGGSEYLDSRRVWTVANEWSDQPPASAMYNMLDASHGNGNAHWSLVRDPKGACRAVYTAYVPANVSSSVLRGTIEGVVTNARAANAWDD